MGPRLPDPPRWRHLDRPDLRWADRFSDNIRQLECSGPDLLPEFDGASRLYLASDYGGDHDTPQLSNYRACSFTVAGSTPAPAGATPV